ncbi:hypothetical protein [Pseudidiomarina sp.]|uniref:hypothetical protein n=1 Tax=Pseudidiomarina sp. TaxID=2081707 RepID=UPI003A987277
MNLYTITGLLNSILIVVSLVGVYAQLKTIWVRKQQNTSIGVMIAQGYYHQIKLIYNSGSTGAVNIRMSQFILLMDVSTIAFALTMGFADGWPLLVLAITSAITKLVIMYLFRWVRKSPLAQQRRVDTC